MPAKAVGAHVEALPPDPATTIIREPHDDPPFRWRAYPDGRFEYPDHEGTAVWTRPCLARAPHILAMRDQGIRTVAEVDDNYLSDPHLNIFMRQAGYSRGQQEQHLRAFACCDAIAFSTEWLRDRYYRDLKKLGAPVPELHVCRNHADLDDWPERSPPNDDGTLRVGWMGSPQHYRDLKLAYGALEWAAGAGHQVVIVGLDPGDEQGVTHPRALEACRRWRQLGYRSIPWVDPEEYHRTPLPLDVGLVPLERNDHTLGKSDVKAVEYTLSGAAVVAQNNEVYNRDWVHGETAMLANSPAEFWHFTKQVCEDDALRERLVSNAQQYVREERLIQHRKHEWLEAISG